MSRFIDADKGLRSKIQLETGCNFATADRIVKSRPTVDVKPVVHARWVDDHCSNCGCDVPAYIIDWKWQKDMDAKFCPMCGAQMDEK